MTPFGASYRLGIAPRHGTVTFVLPRSIYLPAVVRFVAIPLGHDEPQATESIDVDVGTELVFLVENNASLSSLARRR